jgi:hypothetical protein
MEYLRSMGHYTFQGYIFYVYEHDCYHSVDFIVLTDATIMCDLHYHHFLLLDLKLDKKYVSIVDILLIDVYLMMNAPYFLGDRFATHFSIISIWYHSSFNRQDLVWVK